MISPQFVILVPVVIGLVQALKKAGLNTRYAPLVAMIFGVLGTWVLNDFAIIDTIQGLVVGLTASGLWSGTKAVTK
jgi:hypothetical protein